MQVLVNNDSFGLKMKHIATTASFTLTHRHSVPSINKVSRPRNALYASKRICQLVSL